MLRKHILKHAMACLAAAFVLCMGVFTSMYSPRALAFAAEDADLEFNSTDVMDDLRSSEIDGKKFDVSDYSFNPFVSTSVLYLAEYCYSFYPERQGNYSLYLYVWNPQGRDFVGGSTQNSVSLSFGDTEEMSYERV